MENGLDAVQKVEDTPPDVAANCEEYVYPALLNKPDYAFYVTLFAKFRKRGKFMITWNWTAFFLGPVWFAYRGMYAYAALNAVFFSLFSSILSGVPLYMTLIQPQYTVAFQFTNSQDVLVWLGGVLYLFLYYCLVPATADYLHYRHAKRGAYKADHAGRTVPAKDYVGSAIARVIAFWFLYSVASMVIMVFAAPFTIGNQARHVEKDSEPLIQALNDYQSKHGNYPEKLNELVPDHLKELPTCRADRKVPMYFLKKGGSAFVLTCHTFVFRKHSYSSDTKEWRGWD